MSLKSLRLLIVVFLTAVTGLSVAHGQSTLTLDLLQAPEPLAQVTITATDPIAMEQGTDPGEFTVVRTGSIDKELKVTYAVSGTANSADYTALPGSVTIPVGSKSAAIVVKPHDGSTKEPDETVIVTLKAAATYQVGNPSSAVVTIKDNDTPVTEQASLVITNPVNGAKFTAPATVIIQVVAKDPQGYVSDVDFYAGTDKIGQSSLRFVVAPPNGTPISHLLEWTKVPAGEYALTAKAKLASGATVVSKAVNISVIALATPVVTVVATDREAAEGKTQTGGITRTNTGEFTITRTGSLEAALTVRFALTGTAENGVDYTTLALQATIPKGSSSIKLLVTPLDDSKVEAAETVELTLKEADAYRVGSPSSAVVTIADNDVAAKASLTITSPSNQQQFTAPATVNIAVTAVDPKGYISHVVFYSGNTKIGESQLFFLVAPPAGTPIHHTFEWKNVTEGQYVLTAKATDVSGNPVVSGGVNIVVTKPSGTTFVQRVLPDYYAAGVRLTVQLEAKPPKDTGAYAVEDSPPAGWEVSSISNEGFQDPLNHKVKFGPFVDSKARTLTYNVMPPKTETGVHEFTGVASADGVASPVGGAHSIKAFELHTHPADIKPTNSSILIDELTAYAGAWKKGTHWSVDPNPIPISYVTRAAAIWRAGETYHFDASAGLPPACWVPGIAGLKVASVTEDPQAGQPTGGLALSDVPSHCAPGKAFQVTIEVKPKNGVAAYAVEDQPPVGWTVSNINADGQFDPVNRQVKWFYLDNEPRVLSYQVTPSGAASGQAWFNGIASFDGAAGPAEKAINGRRQTHLGVPGDRDSQEIGIQQKHGQPAQLTVEGVPGLSYVLEVSVDLAHWTTLGTVTASENGQVSFEDLEAGLHHHRFYRVRLAADTGNTP